MSRPVAVLDAPSVLGLRPPAAGRVPGARRLPQALRRQRLLERLGAADAGRVEPPPYRPGIDPASGVRNGDRLPAYSVALANRLMELLRGGAFPLVLGGDCSILLGAMLALRRRYGLVSVDGGLTWSDARFLSTQAGGVPARNDQFFPWVDSNPSGNLYAIWFDRRRDPANHDIDTWQAVSTDDGRTWRTYRISTTSWDPDKGFFASGAFIGDYNGIAASDRAVYPVWTDGRNSNFDNNGIGETDIFTNVELLR